ncbi:response regulator transcription factor [Aquiflexum sp. LQ15W]|uniref:response regulator n=1 Tax=Cognataquiflexum nitidum TaxID=2922272 RepID=UPI001F133516|nr:response regulator transcription factor [Cognataquiflexum nitidum]MCH6201266.1 response regulator transcription factor [Cognataquiflexum nitidum]
MKKTILIADDHDLFAGGLKLILETMPAFEMIGKVSNGKELIDFLENHDQVDLLALDLSMPLMDGMQALPFLQRNFPSLNVLVVTGQHTTATMELCRNLGAKGFVGKDASLAIFKEALQEVSEGRGYFQPVRTGMENRVYTIDDTFEKLRETYQLSFREMEIIQMILHQQETNAIAQKLHLSPLTVKTHRKNIFKKLKINNVVGLMNLLNEMKG